IAGLWRHRHQAAHAAVEAEKLLEVALEDPGLRLLAREVDLDESRDRQAARRGLARKRVAELAQLVHGLGLAALQVADEVPAEGRSIAGVLGLEVLGAVLADDLDPSLGERAEVLHVDVLRGGDDRHLGPELAANPLVALANGVSRYAPRPVSIGPVALVS